MIYEPREESARPVYGTMDVVRIPSSKWARPLPLLQGRWMLRNNTVTDRGIEQRVDPPCGQRVSLPQRRQVGVRRYLPIARQLWVVWASAGGSSAADRSRGPDVVDPATVGPKGRTRQRGLDPFTLIGVMVARAQCPTLQASGVTRVAIDW